MGPWRVAVGKDGSQTQRAAAMAAFQTQGKDV